MSLSIEAQQIGNKPAFPNSIPCYDSGMTYKQYLMTQMIRKKYHDPKTALREVNILLELLAAEQRKLNENADS